MWKDTPLNLDKMIKGGTAKEGNRRDLAGLKRGNLERRKERGKRNTVTRERTLPLPPERKEVPCNRRSRDVKEKEKVSPVGQNTPGPPGWELRNRPNKNRTRTSFGSGGKSQCHEVQKSMWQVT